MLRMLPMRRAMRLMTMAQAPRRSCSRNSKVRHVTRIAERGDVIRGVVEYNTHLFSTQRMQRLIGHYEQLLHAIVNNPQQRLGVATVDGERQLLQGFNDTVRALPQDI